MRGRQHTNKPIYGVDRDPYWKDGAVVVRVVRKGLSEEVTLEHTEV